ncbi:MAG: response regulator [Firmicutes bacterium]|nr:response regulator [Bacillota bacterium]
MSDEKYSILVVEDNDDHLFIARRLIEKMEGVSSVYAAKSAAEARREINKNGVDLILLDYSLPDVSGLEFLESLMNEGNKIPVVMVTGMGNEKIAVQAMKLGAMDYIVKDKDYQKLLPDAIKRIIERIRLARSLQIVEAQLQESEERYQKLFENANSGFVSLNLETDKYIKPNKKMLEMTGYTLEELENMHYCELVAEEDKERIRSYQRARAQGVFGTPDSPLDFEFWMKPKDGRKKYVTCTVTLFPQIGEVFITLNDMTDRKELEEKLRIAHEKLQQHARELESEVDDLKKRLVIEPVLEVPTDTEQKYNLDMGVSYLIKEKVPVKSYDVFKDFVSHGTFGLVITKQHPSRIQKLYKLEKTPMVWLSKNDDSESSIPGSNLGALSHAITQFIEKSEKSVVILDGLEHLISINGFEKTIMYIYDIIEFVSRHNSVLIIPVHEDAMDKKEVAIVERATESVSAVLA